MITEDQFIELCAEFGVPIGGGIPTPTTPVGRIYKTYLATDANIVGTYNNGSGGVGATFTVTALGAFTTDGITLAQANLPILFWSQSDQIENGIWLLTTLGNGSTQPVLTRPSYYDGSAGGPITWGDIVNVYTGNTNAGKFFQQDKAAVNVGTDQIVFEPMAGSLGKRASPQIVVGFNTPRQPNVLRDTEISWATTFTNGGGQTCSITLQISPDGSTWQTVWGTSLATECPSTANSYTKTVQAGWYYQVLSSSTGLAVMSAVTELTK